MPVKGMTIPLRPCTWCGVLFSPSNNSDPGLFCSKAHYAAARRQQAIDTRESRFWSYVDRTDECWLWTRSTAGKGYGQFTVGHGKNEGAHRAAWMFATGETLSTDDVIGHTCDTPRCVRNDDAGVYDVAGITLPRVGHLFKGSLLDNNRDMAQKGRQFTLPLKIPVNDHAQIQARYVQGGVTRDELAQAYDVSPATLGKITAHALAHPHRGARNPRAHLSDAIVQEIRRRRASEGVSQQDLADQYGVKPAAISKIVLRRSWQHVE